MRFIKITITIAFALMLSSCATIINHERVNQPHSSLPDIGAIFLDAFMVYVFPPVGIAAVATDAFTGALFVPDNKIRVSEEDITRPEPIAKEEDQQEEGEEDQNQNPENQESGVISIQEQ